MSYASILFEIRDAVATVTINRPDKLNALNAEVIAELGDAAARIEKDPAVRGAILTGAGAKAFVAGADIAEIAGQGAVDGKARALEGQRVFRSLERCGKPLTAAITGFPQRSAAGASSRWPAISGWRASRRASASPR